MEQVVALFGRFRAKEIGLQTLASELRQFLLHHPEAPRQGLGWLDLAQQRQPLPVTEFIQLRADMDYLLRSLALQTPAPVTTTWPADDGLSTRIAPPVDDGLSTRITAQVDDGLQTRIASPADGTLPTLIAATADDATATRIAAPPANGADATVIQPQAMDDAATMIASVARPAEATVVAPAPSDAASSGLHAEQTVLAAPMPNAEATRLAASAPTHREPPRMPHAQRVPPRTVTVATPPPPARSAVPVLAIIGGIALALLVAGGYAWWRHGPTASSSEEHPAKGVSTTRLDNVVPEAQSTVETTPEVTLTPQETVTLKLEIEDTASANQPVASQQPQASQQPAPNNVSTSPLPASNDALLALVQQRIDEGRLLPAEDPTSATYALKALIARAPDSNAVSEGRKFLSQAHLELARKARESGDLEAAQTHLDNAFDVRLMK